MYKLVNLIKRIIPYYFWIEIISYYQLIRFRLTKNYSCRGSIDKKLINLIGKKKDGFFLEVGAYNGISESVSLRFEKELNWKGVLIEPNPIHFKYLKKNRPKNICLNYICLSKKFIKKKIFLKNLNQMSYIVDNKKKLYFNNYPAGRIDDLAKKSQSGNFESYKCKVEILKNIFKRNKISKIDLAIIDVEGSEVELLSGIDFLKTSINYLCIESYNFKRLDKFMKKKKYKLIKKIHREDYVYKKVGI